MRQIRALGRLAAGLAVLTLGAVGIAPSPSPADDQLPVGARPYVPMFSQALNSCGDITALNELEGDELRRAVDQMVGWYAHFNAQSPHFPSFGDACQGSGDGTLAAKLAAAGALVSNYRNGSYVTQAQAGQLLYGEAADLEANAPLAIGTYWPAQLRADQPGESTATRLVDPLDSSATVVRVSSAAGSRPPGTAPTWPYLASRGAAAGPGAHSTSTRNFVSWVRIGDELLQVTGEPQESGDVVTLPVHRGLWGTAPADHPAGERVLSPVYIGSDTADAADDGYSGIPARDDPNRALRYAVKVWQPDGYGWIAEQIRSTFGPDLMGHNAIWLDTTSCTQYNQADPWGNAVSGWDDPLGVPIGRDRWGAHQETKLEGLRAALPGVRFVANNLGGQPDGCTDRLLDRFDVGVLENWLKTGASQVTWETAMDQSFRIQANDWPAVYWVRWNTGAEAARYRRFTYGSLLLSHRPESGRFSYGGPSGLQRPDDLYFWDWGAPRSAPTGIAELAVPGSGLYRRDFAHGTVLVNPTSTAVTVPLDGTYRDVSRARNDEVPEPVSSMTVASWDAVFLMRTSGPGPEPTTTTTAEPATTTTVPPTTTSTVPAADPTPPRTTLSAPRRNQVLPAGPVGVTGQATDNIGVAAVSVTIRNRATGKWWRAEGTWGAWQALAAVPATPGAPATAWSYQWAPPRGGSYTVTAFARDTAGNVQQAGRPTVTFRVL